MPGGPQATLSKSKFAVVKYVEKPLVYILVLTWNGKRDTLECLESVQKISYLNFKIVLIDNGSKDQTVEAVRAQFPGVTILQNDRNLGYAEGNNVGIRYALKEGADSILILNNDVVVSPDVVDIFVDYSRVHPEKKILAAMIYSYKNPEKILFSCARWDEAAHVFETELYENLSKPVACDYAQGCVVFFQREVPLKIGLFDPRFFLNWEDIDWGFRARKHGFEICRIPNAKVWHKDSSSFQNGKEGAVFQYYAVRNRFLWAEKHRKFRTLLHYLKGSYWGLLKMINPAFPAAEKKMIRVRLLGVSHYLIRRFGQAPDSLSR